MKAETERDGPDVDPVSSKSAVTGFRSDISTRSSVVKGHKDVEPRRSSRKRIVKRFADWSDTDENSLSGSRDRDRKRIRKEKVHSNGNDNNIENEKNTGRVHDHGNEQSADLLMNVEKCFNAKSQSETTGIHGDNDDDDIDQCTKRPECVATDSDTDRITEPISSDKEVERPANAFVKSCLKRVKKRKVNSRLLSFESGENSEGNSGKMSNKRTVASREHRCEVCDKVMLRSADLAKHMLVHSGEKPYECDVCGKRFSQAGNMKEHKRTHTGERPFKCEECEKAFVRASDLRAHKVTHSTGKPFSCDECSKSFASAEYLKSHRILHSQKRPFSCDECGMSFHKAATLRNHLVTHSNVKRYPCDLCSKAFHTLGNLKHHQSVHTGDRPYSCDVCHKTFTKMCSVKKHMILHADQRPFSCSQCGKGFAVKAELEIHTRTHTGERPFKCHQCSADFHRKTNLNLHISSVHLQIRQYICEICGKAFAENRSLREHQLIHSGEKPHECDTCGKAFTQSSSLKAHVRSHSGEKPYKCKFCLKAFTHLSTRNRHIRLHTGEKPYKCCLCSAEFARLDVLKEHKRVEHDFDQAERNKTVISRLAGDHSYDMPKDPAVLVLPSVKEDQSLQVIREDQPLIVTREDQLVLVTGEEQSLLDVRLNENQSLQVVREDQPLIVTREDQPALVTGEEQSSLDVREDQPLQVVKEDQRLQPLLEVEQSVQVKNEASNEQFVVSMRDGNLIIRNAAGEYAVDISSMVSSADSGIQLAVDGTCVIASDSHVENADHVLKSDTSEMSYLKLQLVEGDTTRSLFLDTRTFSSDVVSVAGNVGSPETGASFASAEEGAGQQIVFKDTGTEKPDVTKSERDTECVETEAGLDEHKYGGNSSIMESHIGQQCEMSDSVNMETEDNQCDNGSKTVKIEVADDHYMSRPGTMEMHDNEEGLVATRIKDYNLASAVAGQVLQTHDGYQGGLIAEPSDSPTPSQNEKETNFLIVQQDNDSQLGHIVTRLANDNETNTLVQLPGNQQDNDIKIVIVEGDHFDQALEPEDGEQQGDQLQSFELCTADTESQQVYHLSNLSASDLAQLLNGLGDAQSIQQADVESQGEENKGLLTLAEPHSHIDQNSEIQPDNSEGTETMPNNEHSYFVEDENRQPGVISVVTAHPQDSLTAKSSSTPPQATILRDLLTHILPLDSTTGKMRTSSSMHSLQKPSDRHVVDTKITVEGLRQKKRRYGALPKSFYCDMCGKGFTQASSLNKHQVLLHSKDKPFVCSQCQKVCYCKSDLEAHMRIHSGERPFKCPLCDALLKRKANLEQHISAVHMQQRPHVCDICGRGFTEARSLKDHKLIHAGTKPHGCQRCGKAFTQLSTLKKHEQTHTHRVEKPYVCSYCGNSFTEHPALQRHLRKHIGDSVNTFRSQLTSADVHSKIQNS